MVRREEFLTYGAPSAESFKRWMAASVVIGSIFTGGLLLMALAGSGLSPTPDKAVAKNFELSGTSEISAAEKFEHDSVSPFELMKRASDQLPVQPPDEQAF